MRYPGREAEDELARRRTRRMQQPADDPAAGTGRDDEPVHFEWKDILALIIASYQIIMPMVFLFIGVVVLVYLLFRFVFLH